jgi:hypothetical protein
MNGEHMPKKLTPKQTAILALSGTFLLALALELLDEDSVTTGQWTKFLNDHTELNRP